MSNNAEEMRAAILDGPIANGIRVNSFLQHYAFGVIDEEDCPAKGSDINHAVNIVGIKSGY